MLKTPRLALVALLGLSVSLAAQGPRQVAVGDWPEMRGPGRDGVSLETGLLDRWELNGESFLWRVPYGGRSAPIVMGDRVYVQNPVGRGAELRERVMALDAGTGALVWEYTFNIFQSDVPPHRVGWASPAADPETGNIYALSGGAQVIALDRDGTPLWDRSIGEEFAAFTTHGGRTMAPLVDGDLVIVSAAVSNWGSAAGRAHRFIALDKRTGEIVYVANPGQRPFDTAYAPPVIASIDGMRLLIAGLGDGGVHAIKPQTGERVWSIPLAKRAINTGVAVRGSTVYVSHGDENLEGNVMGMLAAVDARQTGVASTTWAVQGVELGYSSPVTDGTYLYQLDNSSRLRAFDMDTGRELWAQPLGTAQKAPPVLADGKIYVGTDGGSFFIIRPHPDRAEILSRVELPDSTNSCCGSEGTPEQILGGAAVSRGRVFFVSSDAVYAIGSREPRPVGGLAVDEPAVAGEGAPAHLQVAPTELWLSPGGRATVTARLFDDRGRFLREATGVTWTLEGLAGTVAGGEVTIADEQRDQAGLIRASAAGLTGEARARVSRDLPWTETFDSYPDGSAPAGWSIVAGSQLAVATVDGEKILRKEPLDILLKRARVFIGPTTLANYTFQADVRATERRRQMGDVGITAQRYSLVLYGTSQRLKLEPWEPETERTVTVPFAWKPDTWYRLKLRVENLPDRQVRARGKAWPAGEPEPADWIVDRTDPIGNREGAPGLFLDAQFGVDLDNFMLTPNE